MCLLDRCMMAQVREKSIEHCVRPRAFWEIIRPLQPFICSTAEVLECLCYKPFVCMHLGPLVPTALKPLHVVEVCCSSAFTPPPQTPE